MPRAYLNYILFDKDFKFVDAGYNQVGNTSGAHQQLMITKPVEQAGFIYIYLSNESNTSHDVYFDDLRITHTKSKVLQEDHYYPFGLSINALSSSAPLSKPNKYLYNGKELQEETGWYDYGARLFDPAIGRFIQVDPLAEVTQEAWTPYHYVKNNPIKYIDPDGMIWKDQKEADRLKENVQNRKEQLAKQKGRLEARIAKREAKGKSTEKLEGRIATINSRTESLDNTIEAIDAIGAHERTFDLVSNSGETNYVKEGSDGVINIQGSSDALHVHEIEHVSRSINSENGLEFTSSGYLQPTTATGLSDEIAGYTAQFGYQPSSLPGSVRSSDDIDLEYIGNLKKKDGTPVYPVLHQIWQNRQKGIRNYKKHKRKQKKDGN
ncbi:RHS repeat-associated core domain-containing protein [uncultured Roseivirga sp.]|uniref:RHS repeat-associated core domain-containing protein n=1 Tax=uncultured Roseivirga sp. TaxID=543088 RepID=UPI0032B2D4F7